MDYQDLILDKQGGVAAITLNRPEKLNPISPQLMQSMRKALEEVEKDDTLKVLILTGAGRAFCSGGDVSMMEAQAKNPGRTGMGGRLLAFALPIYNLSKPTICAVNGVAAGGGWSLAMLCDIRIASEKAWFTMAFVRRGLIPDIGATYFLPRIVGTSKAMEIMLGGDKIDSTEALRLGIVDKVVPQEDLMKVVKEIAEKIAAGPSVAINLTKRAIHRSIHNNLEQQIELEAFAQNVCQETEDHVEGVRAFLAKRTPVFKGK